MNSERRTTDGQQTDNRRTRRTKPDEQQKADNRRTRRTKPDEQQKADNRRTRRTKPDEQQKADNGRTRPDKAGTAGSALSSQISGRRATKEPNAKYGAGVVPWSSLYRSCMKHIGLIGEALTGSAIGAFYAVYDELGSGFLEHIYVAALQRELCRRGHDVARETRVPVFLQRGADRASTTRHGGRPAVSRRSQSGGICVGLRQQAVVQLSAGDAPRGWPSFQLRCEASLQARRVPERLKGGQGRTRRTRPDTGLESSASRPPHMSGVVRHCPFGPPLKADKAGHDGHDRTQV